MTAQRFALRSSRRALLWIGLFFAGCTALFVSIALRDDRASVLRRTFGKMSADEAQDVCSGLAMMSGLFLLVTIVVGIRLSLKREIVIDDVAITIPPAPLRLAPKVIPLSTLQSVQLLHGQMFLMRKHAARAVSIARSAVEPHFEEIYALLISKLTPSPQTPAPTT